MTSYQIKCQRRQSLSTTLAASKVLSLSTLPSTSGLLHPNILIESKTNVLLCQKPAIPSLHSLPSHTELPVTANLSRHRRDSEVIAFVLNKTFAETPTAPDKSETEQELDALEVMLRPRRARHGSFCPLPTVLLPEEEPKLEKSRVWLDISLDSDFNRRKKATLAPRRYINLPKLPFGKHSSYNDETNFRTKIVSKRWKAWKREDKPIPKPKHKYSL